MLRQTGLLLFKVLPYLLALVCSTLYTGSQAQELKLQGSMHGTAAGKKTQTLLKLLVPATQKKVDYELNFQYSGTAKIDRIYAYSSSLNLLRDIPDYEQTPKLKKVKLKQNSNATYTLRIERRSASKDTVIYICGDVSAAAIEGDSLSLKLVSLKSNGLDLKPEYSPLTGRRVFKDYQALFVPGYKRSKYYRIPAILRTHQGTLLALADKRKESQADLPEDIDIVLRRSTDEGRSWSEPITIAQGKGKGKGYGDAAVVQTRSGKILCVFVGGKGLWQSTVEDPIRTYVSYSVDDGLNWSSPRDITASILGSKSQQGEGHKWWASFAASGKGCLSSNNRALFAIAVREGKAWSLNNYALYTDDEGESWKVSGPSFIGGDESKIIELKPSTLLMSIRNKHKGARYYNISYDNGESWSTPSSFPELIEPACNGAIVRYKPTEGSENNILLHSLPHHPTERKNASLFVSHDNGKTWSVKQLIYRGGSAYSDLEVLPSGDILMFLEEDDPISLVFIRMSAETILEKN